MKRLLIAVMMLMALGLSAAPYTDDLGRMVELPDTIERVVPSGNLAQMVLYSITPEKIAGWSSQLSGSAKEEYFSQDTVNLPVFGTFYGKKANLNKEALMATGPDLVIDMGEIKGSKETMIDDLDRLQEDIITPLIFIEAYLDNTPDVYRKLGALLGAEERGESLASFAEDAIEMARDARERIDDPVTVYYSTSPDGLEAIAEGNFHGEVIEKIGAKNVVPSAFGESSSAVSMEQLYIWDPDVILLSEKEAYDEATTDDMWSMLRAVEEGRVYLVPSEPYSFIDAPPATNRIIGIYWLGSLLYPDLYPVDIVEKTIEYYDLYYGYGLTEEHAREILGL